MIPPWRKRRRGENRARFGTIYRWSLRFLAQCACLALLAGCSTADLDCVDLRQGACKVHFTRFATDTSASFSGPEGLGFTYSSSPNAAAISELAAAVRALAERQPLPAMLEARDL
jgi:hypothetical protein